MPFDSRTGYVTLIVMVGLLRLAELALSARNARGLKARGGVESGAAHYPAMVGVHALFLVAAPLEVFTFHRPFYPALGLPMLGLFVLTFSLRYWVIATLRERWCTRVIVLPHVPLVHTGPFRFLRHPNYLAVALEIPALALVHSALICAIVFGGLNLLVLRTRIQVENAALAAGTGGVS